MPVLLTLAILAVVPPRPGPTVAVPAVPTLLRVVARDPGSITVAWDDASGGTARSQMSWSGDGRLWNDSYYNNPSAVPAGTTSYRFTSLGEGTRNYFRIRAIGEAGASDWTRPIAAYTSLSGPADGRVDAVSPRRAFVSWRNRTTRSTRVEAAIAATGGPSWTTRALPADATEATFAGLTPGASYAFRIRAANESTRSAWQDLGIFAAPAEVTPGATSNVRATPIGTGRIDLAFDRVASADSYEILRSGGAPAGWEPVGRISAAYPGFEDARVATGRAYRYRVRATNAAGTGPDSAPAQATTASAAASVTGYDPRLLFSAAQYADLRAMRAARHPWWERLKAIADATATPGEDYGDYGQAAAIAYQVTGHRPYASKAWGKFLDQLRRPYNGYVARVYLMQIAVLSDWIWPGLTPREQAALMGSLNEICDVIADPGPSGENIGLTAGDSDEVVGEWMGVALVDLHPHNPRRASRLGGTIKDARSGVPVPAGGLGPTGDDRSTWRNLIAQYLGWARGGAWFESAEYNADTVRLLIFGAAAVDSIAPGHMEDIRAFAREAASHEMYRLAPDLATLYWWGDDGPGLHKSLARQGGPSNYCSTLMVLAGFLRGDPHELYLNRVLDDLAGRVGPAGAYGVSPLPIAHLLHSPYRPGADWRKLPPSHFAEGQGLLLFRDSGRGSLLGLHAMRKTYIDHSLEGFGDFQLYRGGEWVFTHPWGYTLRAFKADMHNSGLVAGLGASGGYQAAVAHDVASDGSYAYLAAETHGRFYAEGAYSPPPIYLHEWTRSFLFLPAPDGSCDALVLFDRTDAEDPREQIGGRDALAVHWNTGEIAEIADAPTRKQWFYHTPSPAAVPRAVDGPAVEWKTDGGQRARIQALCPEDLACQVDDEKDLFGSLAVWPLGWRVAFRPRKDQRQDVHLTVLSARGRSTPAPEAILVRSSAGQSARGALIRRAGLDDALAMFGAGWGPSRRSITTGYAVSWAQSTAGGEVFLADLDPSKSWTFTIDGASGGSPGVNTQGIARIKVGGRGTHALVLTAR